jgi:hypothetical protein
MTTGGGVLGIAPGMVPGTTPAIRRGVRPAGRFRVEVPAGADQAAQPMAAAAAGVDSLFALQAAAAPSTDLGAGALHARAEVILDGLGALQRGLLGMGGTPDRQQLERLAQDAEGIAGAAADPVLADLLASVALRAEIELARRGWTRRAGGTDRPG